MAATQRQKALWNDPEMLARVELIRALDKAEGLDRREEPAMEVEARATASVCGMCGAETPVSQPVWRRPLDYRGHLFARGQRILPVCFGCRCMLYEGKHLADHCADCRPAGKSGWECSRVYDPQHPKQYCEGCHPDAWRKPEPCQQCGRLVLLHRSYRSGYRTVWRRTADDSGWTDHYEQDRVYCSNRCRSELRAARRPHAGRQQRPCAGCQELFSGQIDSRYCSNACRQRSYRMRKAGLA